MLFPTTYTAPLSDDILTNDAHSAGPALIKLVERYWITEDGKKVQLDPWQRWLLCAVLEKFPEDYPPDDEGHTRAGQLRYRQVVISMGRQNGKSLLAAILSLWGLVQHVAGPSVVGVASTADQAGIVYKRTHYVIKNVPKLNARIKPSATRGLAYRDGSGAYQIKASKGESLQGVPITFGLADELHILKPEVWDSIVKGQSAQQHGLIIGITTAGDEDSELLIRLYKQGQEAIEGKHERFGFFLWEAPEGSSVDTPGAIEAANPAVECGRISRANMLADVRMSPEPDQQRYTLNRFVASINPWLPYASWRNCKRSDIDVSAPKFVSIDRSTDWTFASVSVATKDYTTGHVQVEYLASIEKPTQDSLRRLAESLAAQGNVTFVMDLYSLGGLGKQLKAQGMQVIILNRTDVAQACSTAYAAIVSGRVSHDDQPLVNEQVARGKRKNDGEHWRIVKGETGSDIDALMSTVFAIYAADSSAEPVFQLFAG